MAGAKSPEYYIVSALKTPLHDIRFLDTSTSITPSDFEQSLWESLDKAGVGVWTHKMPSTIGAEISERIIYLNSNLADVKRIGLLYVAASHIALANNKQKLVEYTNSWRNAGLRPVSEYLAVDLARSTITTALPLDPERPIANNIHRTLLDGTRTYPDRLRNLIDKAKEVRLR